MNDRERAEALLDTFATPGWKSLAEEFGEIALQLNSLDGVETEGEIQRRKGKLDVLRILLSYEEVTKRLLDEEDI